ncbi:hypothetical protein [Helicobacter sp. T3_23-1056]
MKKWLKILLWICLGVVLCFVILVFLADDEKSNANNKEQKEKTQAQKAIDACIEDENTQACEWAIQNINLGSITECSKYTCEENGRIWANATTIPNHIKIADLYLQRSIVLGNDVAYWWLGYLYRDSNENLARQYYHIGCEKNDEFSCFGEAGLQANDSEYKEFIKKAENFCDNAKDKTIQAISCATLGMIYEDGQKVSQNEKKAEKYSKKACDELDSAESCYIVGKLYEKGVGKIKQDKDKAKSYYNKACEKGKEWEKDIFCKVYKAFNEGGNGYEIYDSIMQKSQDSTQKSSTQESTSQNSISQDSISQNSMSQDSKEPTPNTAQNPNQNPTQESNPTQSTQNTQNTQNHPNTPNTTNPQNIDSSQSTPNASEGK